MSDDPKEGLTAYHHFFLSYGQFLALWSSFDIALEIALMRLLRLTVKEACTVFASVGFGAKSNIIQSLVIGLPDGPDKCKKIREAIECAERNSFAHGFVSVDEAGNIFTLTSRSVKVSLEVKPKQFSAIDMQRHMYVFGEKFDAVISAFGISEQDLIIYQREVESYGKVRSAQVPRQAEAHPTPLKAKLAPLAERLAQKKARRKKHGF